MEGLEHGKKKSICLQEEKRALFREIYSLGNCMQSNSSLRGGERMEGGTDCMRGLPERQETEKDDGGGAELKLKQTHAKEAIISLKSLLKIGMPISRWGLRISRDCN